MELKIDRIKDKLKRGELVVGAHCTFAESMIPEMIGLAGFDLLWLDGEHSPLDKYLMNRLIMGANLTPAAALVRVPGIDVSVVKPILEMGPDGVIFPNIKTPEEVEKAVSLCLYPPAGVRGFGPNRANRYGTISGDDYFGHIAASIWKVMQIEDYATIENLEALIEVPGIDSLQIGPNDLAASMGMIGQANRPEVKEMMRKLVKKANKAGIPVGTSIGHSAHTVQDDILEWIGMGVDWIVMGSDASFVMDGARAAYQSLMSAKENCAADRRSV